MASDPTRDEVMEKFSKNLKKILDKRDGTPSKRAPQQSSRGVRFNPQTVDVSFGGTESSGKIKDLNLDTTKIDIQIAVGSESRHRSRGMVNHNAKKSKDNGHNKEFKVPAGKPSKPNHSMDSNRSKSPRRNSESEVKHNNSKNANPHNSVTVAQSANQVNGQVHTPVRRHTLDQLKQAEGRMSTPECFNTVSFETPRSSLKLKSRKSSDDDGFVEHITEDSSVVVAVRVRPFSAREIALGETKPCVSMVGNETLVAPEKGETHRFKYDYSFSSFDEKHVDFASQEYVYESMAQPMLGKAFEGYNTCLFAYGQTGSGKSYSIMGHGDDVGIVPRFCEELFSRMDNNIEKSVLNVEISYFEIYNEKIHDLLGPYMKDKTGKKPNLKVREHPVLGPYVEGLSSYVVKSFEDVKGWLNVGNKHRATAATGMNDKSSRSHSVFTMVLTQTRTDNIEGEDHEHSITSKINLVDLAGSERQSVAKTSGDRLREGASINKSLLTLGKVISLLAEQSAVLDKQRKKKTFIPYRDSVLTWLLKESLGGNSKTAMLATISPAALHIEETLSTLRYANTARSIVNIARVNEDPKARLIRELRAEIDKLRLSTGSVSDDVISASLVEITSLREKLLDKEREMDEMTKSWQERLKKSEERRVEEAQKLEKSGIALTIDNKMPNLVNLNEDPQLSEMLLYVLKEGTSHVGRMKEDSIHEIQLNGPLIADNHCVFENGKNVTISPIGDAPTYVNGEVISGPTTLHHGDRVILGGDHYFRFNHPIEVQQGRKSGRVSSGGNQLKDFEFARQELISAQNARLEAELEEARKKHEEMLKEELGRKEKESKIKMDIEMEKVRQKSAMELSMQRHEFNDKLAELEQNLTRHRQKSAESDTHRKEAEDLVKKLATQKLMLEQEVLANRKRLELEAKATQKQVEESRKSHCKIVEQLEREKQKIAKDVQQLKLKRQGTGNTPRLTPLPATKTPSGGDKTDLYRVALLVREANKIAQHLKKATTFVREDIVNDDRTQTLVKVTNSKLSVSTYWTMEKFEDRLLQMREMYQNVGDGEAEETDDVFYDPGDVWEKSEKVGESPGISPKMWRNLKRQHGPSPMATKLIFEADKPSPKTASRTSTESRGSSIMETGFLGNTSGSSDEPVFDENHETAPRLHVMYICRDLITGCLDKFKGQSHKESVADRVLSGCETVQAAVTAMLESYNKSTEDNAQGASSPIETEVMRVRSIQLAMCIELLLSHCSLWSGMYDDLSMSLIKELCEAIMNAVKKLANHVVFFLQGCENDIDSMVQESSAQIFDSLFQLCRHCGELALATETPMIALRDLMDETLSDDEKYSKEKHNEDVKQNFLGGCDQFIEKTIQGSVKTVEDCRIRVKSLEGEYRRTSSSVMTDDLLKQIEVTTNTTKVLLKTLQDAQVELNTTIMDDSPEKKCGNYFQRNYIRSQQLIAHIGNLADSVSLLVQATEPVVLGKEDGSLRRIGRCAEMIQKTALKLTAASKLERNTSSSSLSPDRQSDDILEQSVLTDSQTERQDNAAANVEQLTNSVILTVRQLVGSENLTTPSKAKRMLPASPSHQASVASSKPWHSAKQNKNMKRNLDLVDLAETAR